jgi:hypothetical protein
MPIPFITWTLFLKYFLKVSSHPWVLHLAETYDGEVSPGIDDDLAVRFHPVDVAKGLEELEGKKVIDIAYLMIGE